jgi:hypothetical protein
VKFFSKDGCMYVEMEVQKNESENETYIYEFDKAESLQRIIMLYGDTKLVLFDRSKALNDKMNEFKNKFENSYLKQRA